MIIRAERYRTLHKVRDLRDYELQAECGQVLLLSRTKTVKDAAVASAAARGKQCKGCFR